MSDFQCHFCNIILNSQNQWDGHVQGSKHKQRVANSQSCSASADTEQCAMVQSDGITIRCSVCPEFFCSGTIPFGAHIVGKRHKKNLRFSGSSNQPQSPAARPLPQQSVPQSSSTSSASSDIYSPSVSSASSSSQMGPYAILQADGITVHCSVCPGFFCSGAIPFGMHVVGKRHLKNLKAGNCNHNSTATSAPSSPAPSPSPSSPAPSSAPFSPYSSPSASPSRTPFSASGSSPSSSPSRPPVSTFSVASRLDGEQCSFRDAEESIRVAWSHHPICKFEYQEDFSSLTVEQQVKKLSPHFAFIAADQPVPNLLQFFN